MQIKNILFYFSLFFSSSVIAGVTPWIDFEANSGHIKIPVTINGIEGKAILDTGSQINVINSVFISKNQLDFSHGKKYKIQGVFGVNSRSSFNKVPVSIFDTEFILDNLVSAPFGHPNNQIILGAGFFSRFVVQIDYPQSKMRIMSRDAINLKDIKNVKMQPDIGTGKPIVRVKLNNEMSAWLLLDTGNAGGIMIDRKVAKNKQWLEKYSSKSSVSRGVNTVGFTEVFRLPSIKFGPYELENVLTSVPGENQSTNITHQSDIKWSHIKGKKVRGLLGYDVLKHFVVTIDYKRGYMHVIAP